MNRTGPTAPISLLGESSAGFQPIDTVAQSGGCAHCRPAPDYRSLADTPEAAESATGRLLLGEPALVLQTVVSLMKQIWEILVEPVWPQVRGLLDADVGFQTRRLAEGGLDRLFTELHLRLRWNNGVLTREYGDDEHRDLRGEGLVLVPSAFKWNQVVVDSPWQPTVIYPARRLGTLWQPFPPIGTRPWAG